MNDLRIFGSLVLATVFAPGVCIAEKDIIVASVDRHAPRRCARLSLQVPANATFWFTATTAFQTQFVYGARIVIVDQHNSVVLCRQVLAGQCLVATADLGAGEYAWYIDYGQESDSTPNASVSVTVAAELLRASDLQPLATICYDESDFPPDPYDDAPPPSRIWVGSVSVIASMQLKLIASMLALQPGVVPLLYDDA